MGGVNQTDEIVGRCLCGEVTLRATLSEPCLRACHCDMCRQHTSGAFLSLRAVRDSITVEGPARRYRSSAWAERGFCGTCESTLWYETLNDGARNLAAGLFPDAGGAVLTQEFFHDRCPAGYAFDGDHQKLTTTQTIALFAPTEE